MKIIYLQEVYKSLISDLERLETTGYIENETILKIFNVLESFAIIRGNEDDINEQNKLRNELLIELEIEYPEIVLNGFRHSIAHYGYIRNIEYNIKDQKRKIVWGIGHSGSRHHFGNYTISIDFQKLKTDLIAIIQEELSKTPEYKIFQKFVIEIDMKKKPSLVNEFKQYLDEI